MTTNIDTDMALLTAWQAGDAKAGERLVNRHFDAVCRFFRSKLGDDVGDVVQQTFLDCLEAKHSITSTFQGFLFAIARARLYDHLRRTYRGLTIEQLSSHSLLDLGLTPVTAHLQNRAKEALMQVLNEMPIDTRILLELTYWQDMSASEVAEVVGIPANTVRGALSKARAVLRDRLGQTEEQSVITFSEFR